MARPSHFVPSGRWIECVLPDQPLHKAARRILRSRMEAVSYWLPLAAERSDEDVEYVHQLRVSTRRAVAALNVFSDLISNGVHDQLGITLRRLRLAADAARNLDVLCARLMEFGEMSTQSARGSVVADIGARRQQAQQPIVEVHRILGNGRLRGQVDCLLAGVRRPDKKKTKCAFRQQAPRYLKPAIMRFFKATKADLKDEQALHTLRIRGKNLRYTMEIVAPAFPTAFRKKLYPQLVTLQDILGAINDYATATRLFADWIEQYEDPRQQAFLEGMLVAATKAHEDLRQVFLATWTAKAMVRLREQFTKHCGLP